MTDLNNIVIGGNLVKDVVIKEIGNNKLSNFTIAVNKSIKKGDNWETETSFFDVAAWNKDHVSNYLVKGAKVIVSGELKQDRWEKDGVKNSRVSIVANNIYLCGNAKKSENTLTEVTGNNNIQSESDFPEDVPF